jgi:hypothetical protein
MFCKDTRPISKYTSPNSINANRAKRDYTIKDMLKTVSVSL